MHPNPCGQDVIAPPSPVGWSAGLVWPAKPRPTSPSKRLIPWAVLAALGALSCTAQAALTLHTNTAQFGAAAGSLQTDSFNDLPAGLRAAPLNRSLGPVSYSAAVDPDTSGLGFGAVVPPGEFFVAGSAADAWLSTNTANDTLRFFNLQGTRAIGGLFFGSDVDGLFQPGVDLLLQATDSAGSLSYALNAASLGSFVGFVSNTTLVSLTVRALQPLQGNAWVSVNNLQLAQAVPEPASAALALLGLAGLALVMRRQPSAAA